MNQKNSFIRYLRYIVLYLLIFILAISYHPTIMNMSRATGLENGTILSRYIILLFGVLFITTLNYSCLKQRFIRLYAFGTIIIFIVAFLVMAFYDNSRMLYEARDIVLCLCAIIVGWQLKPSLIGLERILLFFSAIVLFSGVMQVLINIGGFHIEDLYLTNAKNSLGALLGTSVVSSLIIASFGKERALRLVAIIFGFLGIVVIITIRARTGLLSVILVSFLLFFAAKKNHFILYFFLGIVCFFLFSSFIPEQISTYIYDSFFAGTQGKDVSSGRLSVYRSAIHFLNNGENLFLGNIRQYYDIGGWVHNYALLQVYQFGIFFCLPILVLYVYVFMYTIRNVVNTSVLLDNVGFAMVLILEIVSLLEPTFPYGPVTVTCVSYIIFGVSLYSSTNGWRVHRFSESERY